MRQSNGEGLIDCAKRHKQGMDTIKSQFGSNFLDGFIKKTAECKAENDAKIQTEMKTAAFEEWSAHLLIRNSDKEKIGKFTKTLQSQFNLKKNLHPKTQTDAIEVLNDHPHNDCKTRQEKKEDQQLQKLLNKESTESSFAQFGEGKCFICGSMKHISLNCPQKATKPKNQWWINQQISDFQCQNQDDDNNSTASNNAQTQS
jgi:hypothetical protein